MKLPQTRLGILLGGVAAMALLAACAENGGPGFGSQSASNGCRTIYAFTPAPDGPGGTMKSVPTCGASRGKLDTATATTGDQPAQQDADKLVKVSAAAEATSPSYPEAYADPVDMLQHADMKAFMGLVEADFNEKKNPGAWGYAIVDSLAASNAPRAQDILDEMAKKPPVEWMSANHLRPWVDAFAGRAETAQKEMSQLRRILGTSLPGHRALLAEGLGDTTTALAIYAEGPGAFDPPKPEDAGSPGYLTRVLAFNNQRMMALREAELMRAVGRDADAVALLTKLSAAVPDDAYISDRLAKAKSNADKRMPRTLPQAMAQALADEADMIEERQSIMGMMVARGGKIPFNQLLSSMRQSALLLDPDNGDIRLQEVAALYQGGFFEPALRMAQMGNPRQAQAAALYSSAGLAALELGSPETLEALTDKALKLDSTPDAKIAAAGALTGAGRTDRALKLIDQAMKEGLSPDKKPFALLTKGQAYFQAGNIAGAVAAAREARAARDDEDTQQFLASMLVKSPQRAEGLQIMREMMTKSPGNTGLMNNFGYSLIDGYASEAELDEGFRLLKEASRITPDEPNLLDSVGWAYYLYGDFRGAKRYLDLAVEAYQPFQHWELLDHRGDIQWRLGDQDAARKDWKAALAARPPKQDVARISAKVQGGLTEPAPKQRDMPDVPHPKPRGETNDI